MNLSKIRRDLIEGKIDIDSLQEKKPLFVDFQYKFMKKKVLTNEEFDDLVELLMILLDYYTYSSDGDVLISDYDYDMLMNHYIENGGSLITRADIIKSQTRWEFVQHESPGMVGSIRKVYKDEEIYLYWEKLNGKMNRIRSFRIAPKFDGISAAMKINSEGKILLAVTRNDGVYGQNITKVAKASKNGTALAIAYGEKLHSGETMWIKTEIAMKTEDFNNLIQEKKYANRRSATSGIVNSPKNLKYAKYVTMIPLAAHFTSLDEIEYSPMDSRVITVDRPSALMEAVRKMLSEIRDADYPIRTDGVVIYPLGDDIYPNFSDIMDNAIAFKVNTAEALTTIDYGYVSIGRLGKATPMLHVHPVEVNETNVEDVSLGSFDKFANMDLHEGEQILVYSAGDVIPQAKIPEQRRYRAGAPMLEIKKRCPYCGKKLSRYKATYQCENKDCPRVSVGRIANFIIKLGAENVSDKTIEDLIQHGLIHDLPDIFHILPEDIEGLPKYGPDSAIKIVGEFQKIRNKEIPMSSLLGAMGIQGISKKKCRNIISQLDYFDSFLTMNSKKLQWILVEGDNIGLKTASIFVDFIEENRDLIEELIHEMNVVNDPKYKGNIVFTGGRYPDLEQKFEEFGYETSGNVNSETIVVIDSSYNHDSGKCNEARKKGIDIVHVNDVEEVFRELRKQS